MGVRSSLLGITALSTEISTCQQNGQDLLGMLTIAAQAAAEVEKSINAILDFIPAGSNKTTLQTQLTNVS